MRYGQKKKGREPGAFECTFIRDKITTKVITCRGKNEISCNSLKGKRV
jgi:hypothetical protein